MPPRPPTRGELYLTFSCVGPYAVDFMLLRLSRIRGGEGERSRRKAIYDDWLEEGSPQLDVPTAMVRRCIEIVHEK